MSGPEVTYVPSAKDGRTIVVKVSEDRVVHLRPLHARALHVRLGAALGQSIDPVPSRPDQMSDYQRRRLHALLREHGAVGDDRFPVLSKILDREIGSTNDLSPAQADECIAVLQRTRPARSSERGPW